MKTTPTLTLDNLATDWLSRRLTGLDAMGTGTEPAPLVKATSRPVEGGWDIAAFIPWQEFGMEKRPEDFPFDLIVDILDPQTGRLTQISAFDLPSNEWRRLYGKLIYGK
jgi:hypothetical protein